MEKGKKGVVVAWFALFILIAFALLLVYVKHFMPKEEEQTPPVVHKNIVSASYIVDKFNADQDIITLNESDVKVKASVDNEDMLTINYQDDEIIKNYNVEIKNNVLTIRCEKNDRDKEIIGMLFTVLVNSANQYFSMDEEATTETLEQFIMYDRKLDGLNYLVSDTNYSYSADISKALSLYVPNDTITSFTLIDKDNTDYQIIMNDYKIDRVLFKQDSENNTYNMVMRVTNNLADERICNVIVQLYDNDNNVLWSNKDDVAKVEFTDNKYYSLSIVIPSSVDFAKVSKYSIVIN